MALPGTIIQIEHFRGQDYVPYNEFNRYCQLYEAEIKKARREGRELGKGDAMFLWTPYVTNLQSKASADERERLRKAVFDGVEREELSLSRTMENILKEAFFPKPPDPKPLEKVTFPEGYSLMNAINALVDAVNDLRSKA